MSYHRYQPSDRLAPFVSSIWVQEDISDASVQSFPPTRVVPTGTVDIGFYFHEPFNVVTPGRTDRLAPAVLSGPRSTFCEYEATGRTGIVLVHFRPGTASAFLDVPLYEVRDVDVDLRDCMAPRLVERLTDRVRSAATHADRVRLVQGMLESLVRPDRLSVSVQTAIERLIQKRGRCRVPVAARSAGIGSRQLQRRFREQVGLSPKVFGRTMRFQHALALHAEGSSWSMAALDAGFQDQSHLTNDCRKLTGMSPERVFRRQRSTPLASFYNRDDGGGTASRTVYI